MDWLSQYFFGSSSDLKWISVLIMFYDDGHLQLDKGYVIQGKISKDSLGYYCNLSNFTVLDNRLFYCYKNGKIKRIDPTKVLIHLKFGQGIVEPYHWSAFFSSPRNEMLLAIEEELSKPFQNYQNSKIKTIKMDKNPSKSLKVSNCEHPMFKKKQIYGQQMDQVILSDLNVYYL